MQKVKLFDVIVFFITGSMIAKKVVQRCDATGHVLVANSIDNIKMFACMKMVEPQPVLRAIR